MQFDSRLVGWAFVFSFVAAYPLYLLLLALKSRQTISQFAPEGHQKKQGTPTMGGLIIAAGFLPTALIAWKSRPSGPDLTVDLTPYWVFPLLYLGFALIGFIDDYLVPRLLTGKRGLGWKQKIVMQFVVAGGCVWLLDPGHWGEIGAAVFLVLFFSNAYNFSDGLDGLAGLLLIGFGGGILLIEGPRDFLILPLIGAIFPFLFYNRAPAKLFMGDVGSLPIGAIMGIAVARIAMPSFAIRVASDIGPAKQPDFASLPTLAALVLVSGMMIIELVPVPLQILSVKLRKKRLFSFTPIHHAFEKKGWPEERVVAVFFCWQIALSLFGYVVYRAGVGH